MLAVFAFHFVSISFWVLVVPHPVTRHSISPSFQAYTSSPLSFGSFLSFHSASSIHTVSHYPSPFPTHFQRYIFLSATSLPRKTNILNLPHRPVLLQSFQAIVFYNMRLRSVHSFRLHCAPGTTFVPLSEPLRSIMPAFVHPPQHRTA